MRRLVAFSVVAVLFGAGIGAGRLLVDAALRRPPEVGAVLSQVREVARLETLDVSVYKKIAFAPEPQVTGRFWQDVLTWARFSLHAPHGKAIVFAVAHLGLDLAKLGPESLLADGRSVYVALPPVRVTVELQPGETEIIDSSLDSAQTAQLFELAREAFVREVESDEALRQRARHAAERSIRALLTEVGFTQVYFVDRMPGASRS